MGPYNEEGKIEMKRERALPACIPRAAKVLFIVAVVPAAGFAEPAQSQVGAATRPDNASPGERKATWEDIVKLVDAHPLIVAGRHEVAAARAAVDAAGAVPNPSVEATSAYGQAIDDSASRVEWGLALSIPLGWIAQRGAKMEAADAEARVADSEATALRRDLLLQLRVLFWNLVYEQERVMALGELSSQTDALANTVRRRVDKGEARPVEATRIEVEAETISGDLEAARSILSSLRSQLALWLGVRPGQRLVAVADLSRLPRPMASKRARKRALIEHPAVIAAEAHIQALISNVAVERRARVPSVSVAAFTDHELDRRASGVGLAIDLPLWNWNTGAIQQAEATLAAGQKRLEATRIEIEAAAIEAQAACQAGVSLAIRYRDRVLPKTGAAARTIERTYQLGEATLLEVIDARRTLLETRRQFLDTLVKAQTDCSRLAAIAGEEMP